MNLKLVELDIMNAHNSSIAGITTWEFLARLLSVTTADNTKSPAKFTKPGFVYLCIKLKSSNGQMVLMTTNAMTIF